MHFRRRGAEAGTVMLRQTFCKEGALDFLCVGLYLAFKKDTNYEEFVILKGSLSCSVRNACQKCLFVLKESGNIWKEYTLEL